MAYEDGQLDQDEIAVFDAQTLQLRYRFGRLLLNDACGVAVAGGEVFVCDRLGGRIQVFSVAGEHRRSIIDEGWKWPTEVCCIHDRLYVVESDFREEGREKEDSRLRSWRIFVLSLQGKLLYMWTPKGASGWHIKSLCYFDCKLLALCYKGGAPGCSVIALRGV